MHTQQLLTRGLFIFYTGLFVGTFKMMSVEKFAHNWSWTVYVAMALELVISVSSGVLAWAVRVEKYDV
jgi:hypothetical protein